MDTSSMTNMFNGLFGKIEPGKCKLSVNGDIAIQTSSGYKSYNMKTGRLVNCDTLALDIGSEFFFVIPTNHVKTGDIILVNKKPMCVKEVIDKNQITVINYEDSTIDTLIPERHMFLGSSYFYGKIVSMFGNTNFLKGAKGTNKMIQLMMLSEMMKGNGNTNSSNMFSNMLPLMIMSGKGDFANVFDGMFDFGFSEDEEDEDTETEEEE